MALIAIYSYHLEARPDLKIWHTVELDQEFRAERDEPIATFDDYLKLEDTLFHQLQQQVYARIDAADRRQINRYHGGSVMDPGAFAPNWNRTFELSVGQPVAGVLLLHGLSDSPYSMRALAEILHDHGVWVVGLRLPGHGTVPSGLLDVNWEDFVAATRLAAHHVRARIGPRTPFHVVGYSNGAALALDFALSLMDGANLPTVDKLVLLSPAIDVAPAAALALWQARLSELTGLNKLAWQSIEPEFDPYKYNSFTINAANQIYRLTQHNTERFHQHKGSRGIEGFPTVIAFQSVVDDTLPSTALVELLFGKLAGEGHQLVLFDINRTSESEPLLRSDPQPLIHRLLYETNSTFDLTLVTNKHARSSEVIARTRSVGSDSVMDETLGLNWPIGVFSLSHVALPFPRDDPLYGYGEIVENKEQQQHIRLGSVSIRGERNLLQIPDSYFLRQRHNPFFSYLAERMLRFLAIEPKTQNLANSLDGSSGQSNASAASLSVTAPTPGVNFHQ